jgi:hypothetical protein
MSCHAGSISLIVGSLLLRTHVYMSFQTGSLCARLVDRGRRASALVLRYSSRRMLAKTKLRRALEGPAERVASGGGKVTNPMAAAGGQWPCWIPRIAVV